MRAAIKANVNARVKASGERTAAPEGAEVLGDTLELCLLHLDSMWLYVASGTSRGLRAGCKDVVVTARWQALHFNLTELLCCDGFVPLFRGNVALHPDATLLRIKLAPLEAKARLDTAKPPLVRCLGETVPLHLAAHHQAGSVVVAALLKVQQHKRSPFVVSPVRYI